MVSMLIPKAEPFFFPGGKTGCLLVHGFTGTPREMHGLGEYLAQRGCSALGVRLAGHATQPEDIYRLRWEDWLACVEDGWHILRGATERICIVGLSMGGVLSLLFGSRFPVTGVVAMSTPYEFPPDPRIKFIKVLHRIMPKVPKGESDMQDSKAAAANIDYPVYPTRGILELSSLLSEMRASLPQVTAPVLLMHSRLDRDLPTDSMQNIYDHLGSMDKYMHWLEHSGHNIVMDQDREHVYDFVADFVRRVSQVED
jgi:carboxylesterase